MIRIKNNAFFYCHCKGITFAMLVTSGRIAIAVAFTVGGLVDPNKRCEKQSDISS